MFNRNKIYSFFNRNKTCSFGISSPIDIVLHGYPYKGHEVNPILSDIIENLGLTINVEELESMYYDIPCDNGDIFVFGNHVNNCLVFDLYRDPYDQLDVIAFGVICCRNKGDKIRELVDAIRKETDSKVKIYGYDFNSPRWARYVINGDNHLELNGLKQKIIYIE